MLISEGNIKIIKATKQEMINKFRIDFKIHTGEAEALCLAKEKECPLAIDDLPTIKACKIMNQSFLTAETARLTLMMRYTGIMSHTLSQSNVVVKRGIIADGIIADCMLMLLQRSGSTGLPKRFPPD